MDKISIVIVSRNDGYGGDLKGRAILCLNNMCGIYDEVVYVDYNSAGETLIDAIKHELITKGNLHCVAVTPEQASSIYPDCPLGVYEVMGRNIGMRRASGDWIVSSNIDVLAGKPNFNALCKNTLYTVARRGVGINMYGDYHPHRYADLYSRLLLDISRYPSRQKTLSAHGEPIWDPGDYWSLVVSCGDYQIAHKKLWNDIRGFEESMFKRGYADSNVMKKAVLGGYNIDVLDLPVFHLDHDSGLNVPCLLNDQKQYVQDYDYVTHNTENWGCVDMSFAEETI